jgi:lipoic acid synthetase
MLLGDICTRTCTFCAINKGQPLPPDPQEPEHVVAAVKTLDLDYVVLTSVTRDDLADYGSHQFAQTIKLVHQYDSNVTVEVLVPDFAGSLPVLRRVLAARPLVLNHNVETVPRLYSKVRPEANYWRSISLLRRAKLAGDGITTKSGLMLGLGEERREVVRVMTDLRGVGCDLLTIGQYLQPSSRHHKVVRYISPEEFGDYHKIGRQLGFASVISGPLVRSSYKAAETYLSVIER